MSIAQLQHITETMGMAKQDPTFPGSAALTPRSDSEESRRHQSALSREMNDAVATGMAAGFADAMAQDNQYFANDTASTRPESRQTDHEREKGKWWRRFLSFCRL